MIALVVGSLRAESHHRSLAEILQAQLADWGIESVQLDVDLPIYSDERLAAPPAAVTKFADQIRAADGVIWISPEYNGSVSGGIKNAIDWMSRPRADAPIASKPSITFTGSPSAFGGVWAGADLRRVLKIAGAKVLSEDDLPLSGIDKYREGGIPDDTYAAIVAVLQTLVDVVVAQPVS